MPWTPDEAPAHTGKANTPKKRRMWADIATRLKDAGKSDGDAVRIANGVIKKRTAPPKRRPAPAAAAPMPMPMMPDESD